jgi:hypothetical protein
MKHNLKERPCITAQRKKQIGNAMICNHKIFENNTVML